MSNSELLACPPEKAFGVEVSRIYAAVRQSGDGDHEDIATYAKEVVGMRTQLDELRAALFEPIGSDVSYNLQGVLHDLEHQFNPNDGGVCARTVRGAIEQIEIARKALGGTNPEMEKLMRDAAFSASEHKYDPDTSHE